MSEADDPQIEEYRKEYSEQMRRGFEGYRKAGLGISATIIFMVMILFKVLLEEPVPGAVPYTTFLCKLLLVASVLSALAIQFFNYFGAKWQAYTYRCLMDHFRLRQAELPLEAKKRSTAKWLEGKEYSDKAEPHHRRADKAVEVSIILFILGFIAWLFATRYLF